MKINYQQKTDEIIAGLSEPKTLLLHSCCAPCSSYVLEYLSQFFKITIYYFNPNIAPQKEYIRRLDEQKRFISCFPVKHAVSFAEGEYQPDRFHEIAKGLEDLPEGGERCYECYKLRLYEAASFAKKYSFDYFTTTLSISPHKNADWLNQLGEECSKHFGVDYLYADFKKRDGYKRSIKLSEEYGLYRQDYCGCIYSKNNKT